MKISIGPATLLYPAPVLVIGTYDKDDQPNIMTASWSGICCSNPPCVAVSVREATYTHGNLMKHKAFTINIPPEDQLVQTVYVGFTSGRAEKNSTPSDTHQSNPSSCMLPSSRNFPSLSSAKSSTSLKSEATHSLSVKFLTPKSIKP